MELAQLATACVGQHRGQRSEHGGAIQLRRRTGVVVPDRHVHRLAGPGGEAQAHQVGLHRIQAVGLGVEGEFVRLLQLRDQGIELRRFGDGGVLASHTQRGIERRIIGDGGRHAPRAACAAGLLLGDG